MLTASMPQQQLRDELVTILAGSLDSTASALAWLIFELARHPELQQRLQEEIDDVVAARSVNHTDLASMPFLHLVIDETLRRHSAAWIMTRRAAHDLVYGDVRNPAGADLMFSPMAMLRDPDVYPDPMSFDPERWTRQPAETRSFIPFGAGARHCIGEPLARATTAVLAVAVFQKWTVQLQPGAKVREVPAVIFRPNRVPVHVTRR